MAGRQHGKYQGISQLIFNIPIPSAFFSSGNKEPEVVQCTAETLRFLSSHPDNPEYMCREKGLVQSVVKQYQSTTDPKLKPVLADVMRNLHSAIPGARKEGEKSPSKADTRTEPDGGEQATSAPKVATFTPPGWPPLHDGWSFQKYALEWGSGSHGHRQATICLVPGAWCLVLAAGSLLPASTSHA